MSKNIVVIGTQWGDEGKGKIVDWLAESASGVVSPTAHREAETAKAHRG